MRNGKPQLNAPMKHGGATATILPMFEQNCENIALSVAFGQSTPHNLQQAETPSLCPKASERFARRHLHHLTDPPE